MVMNTDNTHQTLSTLIDMLESGEYDEPELYSELAPLYDFMFTNQSQATEYFNRQTYETKNAISPRLVHSSVLEVGCGTGSLLARLETDYEYVYGIEQHEEMIRIASQKVDDSELIHGRLETVNIDVDFDGVVLYEYLISEMVDVDEILLLLKRVNDVLIPGGAVVFDVITDTDIIMTDSVSRIEDEEYRLIVESSGEETEQENVYRKTLDMDIIELQTGHETSVKTSITCRVFDIDEIDTLVHDSGFEDVRIDEENGVLTVSAIKPTD